MLSTIGCPFEPVGFLKYAPGKPEDCPALDQEDVKDGNFKPVL